MYVPNAFRFINFAIIQIIGTVIRMVRLARIGALGTARTLNYEFNIHESQPENLYTNWIAPVTPFGHFFWMDPKR